MTQFYPVTLQDAIRHHRSGDLTAKGLLHFYLKIKLKPGWKLSKSQKTICRELGIGRTAFYSALSRLKTEGSITWSVPENTRISISLRESAIPDEQSAIPDEQSAIPDEQSAIPDEQSAIPDEESLEPLPQKDSRNPSDFSSNSSSNSSQSFFSGQKKENFENSEVIEGEVINESQLSCIDQNQNQHPGKHLDLSEGKYSGKLARQSTIAQGAWFKPDESLRADFWEWRARWWIEDNHKQFPHGVNKDAISKAKCHVLAYWRNEDGRIQMNWEAYKEKLGHQIENAQRLLESGLEPEHLHEDYKKAIAQAANITGEYHRKEDLAPGLPQAEIPPANPKFLEALKKLRKQGNQYLDTETGTLYNTVEEWVNG
jgi:hypothetical protein